MFLAHTVSRPKLTASQANALAPNWGATIFQTANEITANKALRKQLDEIEAQKQSESEWWEKRRADIEAELLSEGGVDAPKTESSRPTSKAGKPAAATTEPTAVA